MTTTTTTTTTPQVGEKAPEIALNTADGKPWRLSEAVRQGPMVLCFMPGAFTGTCTKEMCAFTDRINDFQKTGAQVVGITVDSKHAQAAWSARDNIQVPLVSDFEKKVLNEWGLGWASSWGLTYKRATFVLDRSGTVRYANVQANASEEPPYDEVRRAVEAAK